MWKPRYRIRQIIHPQFYWSKGEYSLPDKITYIVERRLCYFWWYRESNWILYLQDEFIKHSDAVEYISKRNGKLILDC